MNNALGFIAINIEDNPQSKFTVDMINKLSDSAPYMDHILFNSYYQFLPKESNRFATMHINEAKYFTGPLVAFSLKDALFLKQCISNKKIFFMIEPEWMKSIHVESENYENMKLMQYATLRDIYVDSIDILCTNNPDLKNIVDIAWKESVLVPDSECEKLYEYL
jgi:hypothetical protein